MAEVWKPIPGYEFRYEVSSLGRVRRVSYASGTNPGLILSGGRARRGFHKVDLWRDGKRKAVYVHVVVAAAFKVAPKNPSRVSFRDGDPNNLAAQNLVYRRRKVRL